MNQTTANLPSYIKLNDRIRPQDDFYAYVCHHWCQDNPLPATRSRWGLFNALSEKVNDQIEAIINDWLQTKQTELTSEQQQAVIYYKTLINKDAYQENSAQTLAQRIEEINSTKLESAGLLAKMSSWGLDVFFSTYAEVDSKNNKRYCLTVDAPDLDLPNRDYYISRNPQMKLFRQAYLKFLEEAAGELAQVGLKSPLAPEKILEIETFLAEISWPMHKAVNLKKTYNPFTWSKFTDKFDFDWTAFCKGIGITADRDIIVTQPDYLEKTLAYLSALPADDLRGYLIHKLLLGFGDILTERIAKTYFNFFGKTLSGIENMKTLEKRTAESTNHAFCDVLGKAYVERHFPPAYKQQVEELSDQISQAFRKRLGENTWMSAPSRLYAQKKLDEIIINTGYSGYWDSYDDLEMLPDNPLHNASKIIVVRVRKLLEFLNQQPDRHRFLYHDSMPAEGIQNVNAWTSLVMLNTNYPAAFLQTPFYNHEASWEYNLGSLGCTIGHELTHNFDNQGSNYDHEGHLAPWLNKEEQHAFKKEAEKFIKLANQYHPTPKVRMKGKQVIGELIADLGGLEITLDVVKDTYKDDPEKKKQALREVFITYSFHWATNATAEVKTMLAKSGVHPDGPFRVNGIVRHCDDFYEVFDVKESDNLYLKPEERVRIW